MLRKLAGKDVRTDTVRLDITDLEAVRKMVSEQEVQVIVNCAAYTNVDKAEENYGLAELLNAKAVENLAVAMREVDGLLDDVTTSMGGVKNALHGNENLVQSLSSVGKAVSSLVGMLKKTD